MTLLTHCPFCSSDLMPHWPAINVWKCSGCGLLPRNPVPSSDELAALYEESWSDPHQYVNDTGGTTTNLARAYAKGLTRGLGLETLTGLRLLEYGAGRGAMVEALSELGASVYAVEPFGYEYLRQRGIPAFRSLEDLPAGLSFDGIITIDVIEHLVTPWRELIDFQNVLAPRGWVYVATVNTEGLRARVDRANWREALKPSHVMFFTPRSLETILNESGYRRHKRLRWFVKYTDKMTTRGVHCVLQWLRLDGELRYLAYRS